MRVMVIVKATDRTEAGLQDPSGDAMNSFNDELVQAGVLLAAEGLRPSSAGARVTWTSDANLVRTDGPFTEAKELVAGYWIWQVRSLDEAIEWLKRSPFRAPFQIEVRPIHEWDEHDERALAATEARQAVDRQLRATGADQVRR